MNTVAVTTFASTSVCACGKTALEFLTIENPLTCSHLPTLPTKRKRPLLTRKVAFLKSGSPGGIRTPDQLVNSQLLYRLSYRGTIEPFSNIRAGRFLGGKRIQPACCMLTKIHRAGKNLDVNPTPTLSAPPPCADDGSPASTPSDNADSQRNFPGSRKHTAAQALRPPV